MLASVIALLCPVLQEHTLQSDNFNAGILLASCGRDNLDSSPLSGWIIGIFRSSCQNLEAPRHSQPFGVTTQRQQVPKRQAPTSRMTTGVKSYNFVGLQRASTTYRYLLGPKGQPTPQDLGLGEQEECRSVESTRPPGTNSPRPGGIPEPFMVDKEALVLMFSSRWGGRQTVEFLRKNGRGHVSIDVHAVFRGRRYE